MKILYYQISLLEPMLVTALDGDPNSAVAFDYIPGSVLRGALLHKYLRAHSLTAEQALDDKMAARLFFSGALRFLNGYWLKEQTRAMPAPLSWQQEKGAVRERDESFPVYDFALARPRDWQNREWKYVDKPFCLPLGQETVRLVSPRRALAVHTARNRRLGRPTERGRVPPDQDPGAIYRYNALARGQSFRAAIVCDDDADAARLPALDGYLNLGGARSAGYGRVQITRESELDNTREAGSAAMAVRGDRLIVTLMSDTLLRAENGSALVDANLVKAALQTRLGVPLEPFSFPHAAGEASWAFLRGRLVAGFNRSWGMPLPQMLAVTMGSVFVFQHPAIEAAKLIALETQGIGERRAEGFGRVAVNWQRVEQLTGYDTLPARQTDVIEISNGTARRAAEQMVERMLRAQLDVQVKARARDFKIKSAPSQSQLARLRNVLREEAFQRKPDPRRVVRFLDQMMQQQTARRQLQDARVGQQGLDQWIVQTLRKREEEQWRVLMNFREDSEKRVGAVRPRLSDELRDEYLLRLVDETLARAAKDRASEED